MNLNCAPTARRTFHLRVPAPGDATTERLNENGFPESADTRSVCPPTCDDHLSVASPSTQSSPDGTKSRSFSVTSRRVFDTHVIEISRKDMCTSSLIVDPKLEGHISHPHPLPQGPDKLHARKELKRLRSNHIIKHRKQGTE